MRLSGISDRLDRWWRRVHGEGQHPKVGEPTATREVMSLTAQAPARRASPEPAFSYRGLRCPTDRSGSHVLSSQLADTRASVRRDDLLQRSRIADSTVSLALADTYYVQQRRWLCHGSVLLSSNALLSFAVTVTPYLAQRLLAHLNHRNLVGATAGSLATGAFRCDSDKEALWSLNQSLKRSGLQLTDEGRSRLAQLLRLHRAECQRMRLFDRYLREQKQRHQVLAVLVERFDDPRMAQATWLRSVRQQLADTEDNLRWAAKERDTPPSRRRVNSHLRGQGVNAEGDLLLPGYTADVQHKERSLLLYLPPPAVPVPAYGAESVVPTPR